MGSQQTNAPKAAGTETPGAAAMPVAPSTPADNTEARIAEQRLKDLEKQASEAVAAANTAKADAEGFKGELERVKTELAGLKATNERLEAANRQLTESATAR